MGAAIFAQGISFLLTVKHHNIWELLGIVFASAVSLSSATIFTCRFVLEQQKRREVEKE